MSVTQIKHVLTIAIASLMMASYSTAAKEAKETPVSVEEVVNTVFSGSVQKEAVIAHIPGAALTVRESIQATATIQAIDAATRNITLLTKDEKTATFTAGPDMKNFDKLAAGDTVTLTYTEAVAIYKDKDEAEKADAVAGVARSVETPAGALFGGVKVTATVLEVDAAKHVVKLEMADKSIREVMTTEDVDLSKIQAGDAVTVAIGKVFQVEVTK